MICTERRYVPNKGSTSTDDHYIKVDCGRCYSCLSNKRNEWTLRMLQETKHSESSLFLTLTYDEQNLKWIDENGRIGTIWENNGWNPKELNRTLFKPDLQRFNKRLRSRIMDDKRLDDVWFKKNPKGDKWSPKYRYMACGEYGSDSNRPHYHLIAWNIPDTWFEFNDINQQYYSNELEDLWDMGFIHIGTATQQSIHYVAKYTLKDLFNDPSQINNVIQPFAIMSRNPGIGQNYVTRDIKNYYSNTLNPYATIEGNYKFPLPRFYKKQVFNDKERQEVNEKSFLYCTEKEERERAYCEETGIDFDTYKRNQSASGLNKIKRSQKRKITKL